MEKQKIGENAGKVWRYLNSEVDEITIPRLAAELNLSEESVALAAGWLAREDQICIKRVNGIIMLSSREKYYEFCFG